MSMPSTPSRQGKPIVPTATRPEEAPQSQQTSLQALKQQVNQPLTILILTGVFLAIQFLLSLGAAAFSYELWLKGMAIWDSNWYETIARNGYATEQSFAFFPLWPLILATFAAVANASSIHLVGLSLSVAFFIASIWLLSPRNDGHTFTELPLLRANHSLALLPLIFAHGAWVYVSNHTEAFFLFLTVLAFQQAYNGRLIASSVIIGLAALTRNQGVMAAAAIGCYFLMNPANMKLAPLARFALSGAISGAIFSLWPIYQFLETGQFLVSTEAQKYWQPASTVKQYIDNMLWISLPSLPRVLWFWAILGTGIFLVARKKDRAKTAPIGIYLILSVIVWPLQGQKAINGFRYGAVLFPFWLLMGDYLAGLLFTAQSGWRGAARRIFGFSLAGYLISGMIMVTCHYFFDNMWAY